MSLGQFDRNELYLNDKIISFNKNIRETRIVNDIIIVLIDVQVGNSTLDNVYGVNFDGEFKSLLKN